MNLRVYSSKSLSGAFVLASIVLIQSTGWAQSLTGSANPPSGGAGVTYSYLTGSGFPAGAITGATVSLGTTCAAPAVASGTAQVTVQGALRRFQFLIPAGVAPGAYKVWVSGLVGTTPFNTVHTPSCSAITVTSNVTGTASLGAAISGGVVMLVDANGVTATGTTASDGTLNVNSTGLTPPFLVRVVTTSAYGNFPSGTTLYSVSADGNVSTHINVSVLTDLLIRTFYSAQGIDIATAFAAPQTPGYGGPTPVAVQSIALQLIPVFQLWLDQMAVNATPGAPSGDAINLISSPFTAYPPGVTPPSGLDGLLHIITAESISNTDTVIGITVGSGNVTETITPVYPGGNAFTYNTMTLNSVTGAGSSESFSGLVVTPALQSVVDGINSSLATFASIINANGAALTGSELLPDYAPDYLNDGNSALTDATHFAMDVAGVTVKSLKVFSLKFDPGTNLADVRITYDIVQSGQEQTGNDFEAIFKQEGGTWLQYGDQLIGQVSATAESRTSEGEFSGPTGIVFQTDIGAFVNTPTSLGVTGITISGGGNIWNGASSAPLFPAAELIQNGQTFNAFNRLSQNLGFNLATLNQSLPPGTPFTFTITSPSGTSTEVVKSGPFTTEKIFIFQNVAAGSGPLSSVVGKTITYTWTLPTSYSIGNVSLFVYIADGPNNVATTHTCSVGSNTQLTTTSTSGAISIPSDMSACGLSSSDAIKQVNVFVSVNGTNGESNLVNLAFPY